MFYNKNNCPVPLNQQPFNEYLELKQSLVFKWSTYEDKKCLMFILAVFLFLFFFIGLFIYFFFIKIKFLQLFILDFVLLNCIFVLVFIRLYLGWSYLLRRLLSATVFYEESGWYDGQIWLKGSDTLMKDRFIGIYYILPILKRVKYGLFIFFMNIVINYFFIIFFNFI